jgi:hypothetical protein
VLCCNFDEGVAAFAERARCERDADRIEQTTFGHLDRARRQRLVTSVGDEARERGGYRFHDSL